MAKSTRFAPVFFIISRFVLAACLLAFLCVRHYENARLRQLRTVGSGGGTVSALQTYAGAESVVRGNCFDGSGVGVSCGGRSLFGNLEGGLTNPMVDSGVKFQAQGNIETITPLITVGPDGNLYVWIDGKTAQWIIMDPLPNCNKVERQDISPACWQGKI